MICDEGKLRQNASKEAVHSELSEELRATTARHHGNGRFPALLADEFHDACGRGFQAADNVQQRRLAAARRADDAEELVVTHVKINTADSANVALARRVDFGQSANNDLHVTNDGNLQRV